MKISIVTISYNQSEFLERAIRSVIKQDYEDIEYIVVDAGSTDGSREIIERYQSRMDKIIFEPDEGPADGLNKGFAVAIGEICGCINADDAYLPGAIREVVDAFQGHPEADVVYGDGYIIDAEGRPIRRFRSNLFSPVRFVYGGGVVVQQSTFFKKTAFNTVGGFNPENRSSWDAELLLRFGLAGMRFLRVRRYWSLFTTHPDSIGGSQRLYQDSKKNHRRYFKMVMGRQRCWHDRILRRLAWIQKWILDPRGFLIRLYDALFSTPVPKSAVLLETPNSHSKNEDACLELKSLAGDGNREMTSPARSDFDNQTNKKEKSYSVAILSYHPMPYHVAFYRAVNAHARLHETVLYLDRYGIDKTYDPEFKSEVQWDLPLLNGYHYKFLKNVTYNRHKVMVGLINPGLFIEIGIRKYDAVLITSYSMISSYFALFAAKLTGKKVILRAEADLLKKGGGVWRRLKNRYLFRLLKMYDAVMYSCQNNRYYFQHFGVPDEKLFPLLSAVDNAYFRKLKGESQQRRKNMRARFGIPKNDCVILFTGRLIDRKCPLDIIAAYAAQQVSVRKRMWLVFVGDGPLRAKIQNEAKQEGFEQVILAGFKNASEMPDYYFMSDILVLPSVYDPTPKTVNEACVCGLPAIVSTGVGTANDLVRPGQNGYVFETGNIKELSSYLEKLVCDETIRESMASCANKASQLWSTEANAAGLVAALDYVFEGQRKPVTEDSQDR